MKRLKRKSLTLLLAAGIAGGMFVAGCASKDVRQEAVATVNGEEIKGVELREILGVPAGVFALVDIPVEKKKEALDQLVAVRLLAQEGRVRGIDNTPRYKEALQRNEPLVRIKALVRKEIEAKLKVTPDEVKAEIAKVKEANKGISDADAATRSVKSISDSRVRKIQEDLIAAAKKETAAAVDPEAVARIGKEQTSVPTLEKFRYLLATGKVSITQGTRVATCGRAEVLPREEKVVLTENPVVIDHATDFVSAGERITMLRGQERVEVEKPRLTGPAIKDLGFDRNKPAASTETPAQPPSTQ